MADNIFNPDPYLQQGGDMVRVGGLSYTIDVNKPIGSRISDLKLVRSGAALAPDKDYVVAGWASANEGTEGPPIWDVVFSCLDRKKTVAPAGSGNVKIHWSVTSADCAHEPVNKAKNRRGRWPKKTTPGDKARADGMVRTSRVARSSEKGSR